MSKPTISRQMAAVVAGVRPFIPVTRRTLNLPPLTRCFDDMADQLAAKSGGMVDAEAGDAASIMERSDRRLEEVEDHTDTDSDE